MESYDNVFIMFNAVYIVINVLPLKRIIYIVVANVLLLNVSNAANGAGHSLWSCSGHIHIPLINSSLIKRCALERLISDRNHLAIIDSQIILGFCCGLPL